MWWRGSWSASRALCDAGRGLLVWHLRVAIDALGGSLGAFRTWTGQRDRMRCATRALPAETWNWKRRGHQLLAAGVFVVLLGGLRPVS